MGLRHIPVLVEEVISLLNCEPHQTYVDATLGGGGHALEILETHSFSADLHCPEDSSHLFPLFWRPNLNIIIPFLQGM